jgi:alanine-glyoxylate transaminase / serine-glyoxylate transaminase / serine-pyruvate transaminase
MLKLDQHPSGRHFLHIPGPSPVPSRILRAISYQTIDHRGPEFGELGLKLLAGMQTIFKTKHPVIIYPSSGTGAWEGALVNTLSPGDLVLMYETGHFATLWNKLAQRLGIKTEFIGLPGAEGWRHGVDAAKSVLRQIRVIKLRQSVWFITRPQRALLPISPRCAKPLMRQSILRF